jgi:hypothetical protein
VYIAVDESGDPGPEGSKTYALGCLKLDRATWFNAFDQSSAFDAICGGCSVCLSEQRSN